MIEIDHSIYVFSCTLDTVKGKISGLENSSVKHI